MIFLNDFFMLLFKLLSQQFMINLLINKLINRFVKDAGKLEIIIDKCLFE